MHKIEMNNPYILFMMNFKWAQKIGLNKTFCRNLKGKKWIDYLVYVISIAKFKHI